MLAELGSLKTFHLHTASVYFTQPQLKTCYNTAADNFPVQTDWDSEFPVFRVFPPNVRTKNAFEEQLALG